MAGPEKASKSLNTLCKIINNVLKNIDDPSKRELKLSNTIISRDIVPHPQACDILVIVNCIQLIKLVRVQVNLREVYTCQIQGAYSKNCLHSYSISECIA